MPNTKKCKEYRKQLALKQYQASKYDINGAKSIHEFQIIIFHINALLEALDKLNCTGIDYLQTEPKQRKYSSTKLKLRRSSDPKKLFIKSS